MRKKKSLKGSPNKQTSSLENARRSALKALNTWRNELEKEIRKVDDQLAALEPLASSAPGTMTSTRTVAKPVPRKRTKKTSKRTSRPIKGSRQRSDGKKTLIQTIVDLLKQEKGPMRPVEIAKTIQNNKLYRSQSKNIYNAVMTNLVRSARVRKLKDGRYVAK